MPTLAAAAIAALALGAVPAQATKRIIVIEGMQFHPASMTAERGDEVVWINKDLVAHTATAAGAFDSHAISPGQSWAYIARAPGRYAYKCTLHPTMNAMLIVEKSHGRRDSR